MFDYKLFHRLLAADDPAGWLVAMDMLEETPAGEGHTYDAEAMSRLWRRRAAWWPGLHAKMGHAMLERPEDGYVQTVTIANRWEVHFIRRSKVLRVYLFKHVFMDDLRLRPCVIPPNNVNYEVWLLDARDPRYHRKRLLRRIDALGELEDAQAGR